MKSTTIIYCIIHHSAGQIVTPSEYGSTIIAGVVEYNVTCNGNESSVEDCIIDQSPYPPSTQCQDPAVSAAGVECTAHGTAYLTLHKHISNSVYKYLLIAYYSHNTETTLC